MVQGIRWQLDFRKCTFFGYVYRESTTGLGLFFVHQFHIFSPGLARRPCGQDLPLTRSKVTVNGMQASVRYVFCSFWGIRRRFRNLTESGLFVWSFDGFQKRVGIDGTSFASIFRIFSYLQLQTLFWEIVLENLLPDSFLWKDLGVNG